MGMAASTAAVAGVAVVVGSVVVAAQGVSAVDLIDAPSRTLVTALKSMVSGVASQGGRTVAVGPRGLILLSEDGGGSWRQVGSPVSTDLATVRFAGPNVVWAVGHDAVALRSTDGGASWERMLDGRTVLRLLRESAKGSERLEAETQRASLYDAAIRLLAQRGFAIDPAVRARISQRTTLGRIGASGRICANAASAIAVERVSLPSVMKSIVSSRHDAPAAVRVTAPARSSISVCTRGSLASMACIANARNALP